MYEFQILSQTWFFFFLISTNFHKKQAIKFDFPSPVPYPLNIKIQFIHIFKTILLSYKTEWLTSYLYLKKRPFKLKAPGPNVSRTCDAKPMSREIFPPRPPNQPRISPSVFCLVTPITTTTHRYICFIQTMPAPLIHTSRFSEAIFHVSLPRHPY